MHLHPPVIALVGPRGSGKDTLAAALMQAGGYRPLTLDEPLKILATTLWPDGAPRDLLQHLGAACTQHDPTALARRCARIIHAGAPRSRWVISDLRRPDEVATLRAAVGPRSLAVWWAWSPASLCQARLAHRIRADGLRETEASAQDATETLVDFPIAACDAIWDNHRSVPDPVTTWASWLRAHPDAWHRRLPRYHDLRTGAARPSSASAPVLIP